MQRWQLLTATVMVVMAMLMLVGCAAMTSRESTGEFREDDAITANVKSSFVADPLVSTSPIEVETTRGVVYLSGTVSSEQERAQAIRLTQGVAGVKEIIVRNLIVQR
ncbi:MAG TPA: BON domain-containing protein [Candidatus Tectomicrobia bacterium]|nr:BON domain-containing protein [Candidatus Tectomicrobia bacterium]